MNSPDGIGSNPHEYIPFLLVSDGAVSLGDFVRVHQLLEARQGRIVRVERSGKGQVPCSVFMTGIDEGRIGEGAQIGQRRDHLRAIPFEEATTATSKECVTSEDHRGGVREGPI